MTSGMYKPNKKRKSGVNTLQRKELQSLRVPPDRVCVECGEPTYDYRCVMCRAKHKLKHGIQLSPLEYSVYYRRARLNEYDYE